ncbi:DUF3810 domain-containing protein [Romboutsia sp.]|uniref:DUF3810 domain-containing protein n=1 Tax=Romboutsia sp. TaxID=1965302 RepID=UPI002CF75C83|nr:DUF3810 domain-containing protein [Romboutsia sp.]HSQ89595.1 DUF3810 domain-containing protein [Romboutsia sp.]
MILNFIGSKFPDLIDKYYSCFINKFTVQVLSKISGFFPFSLYEVTMYLIVFSILLFIIHIIINTFKNSIYSYRKRYGSRRHFFISVAKNYILNILSILSIAYFLFIVLWGLNYNRVPLQTTLINNYNLSFNKNISSVKYNAKDLAKLYNFLINKANETRKSVLENNKGVMKANSDYKGIIDRAKLGYDNIDNILPQTVGSYANPKYVLSSNLMCYTGITGIYFPFTGEANVNVAIPDIYIPSTVIHEMAHQRGFASEDEANFLGYLASINHPDIDFNYSGYILALNHTANALYKADYDTYVTLTKTMSDDVRRDLINNNQFWDKYEGKVDEISNQFNDSYLKANGVKEGTASYGKMVDLLLTYYKLYPEK